MSLKNDREVCGSNGLRKLNRMEIKIKIILRNNMQLIVYVKSVTCMCHVKCCTFLACQSHLPTKGPRFEELKVILKGMVIF